jgi:tetratricopeptide (TPR) repeat protein
MKRPTSTQQKAKVLKPEKKPESSFPFYYIAIIILTCILYGNTLSNKYALDDLYAITGNTFTQKGFSGIPDLLSRDFFAGYYGDQKVVLTGGRYRPLSLVTFAIEHQFFGENPGISHFINLLLYALTGCLLFSLLKNLLRGKSKGKWFSSIPFIASLLFIAHPVHTEVVANIKGRDEILSLLGALLTAFYSLQYIDQKKYKYLIYSFISFLLACLSKENAFLFILIIPVMIYFFREFRWKENLYSISPILLAGLLFWLIRISVLGNLNAAPSAELLDNPFVEASLTQKYATIIFSLGMYVKLLFIPHPLTWDYYPYHISLKSWGDGAVIASLLVYALLIVFAIIGIRKKKVLSFSILYYLIGIFLVSNILFQVGVFMAERFLYLPSVGFCLAIAWLWVEKVVPGLAKEKYQITATAAFLALVLFLFSFKTISRNKVWKDDFVLHTVDAETSYNSAKGNNIAGQWYAWAANQAGTQKTKDSLLLKAYELVNKAVTIHPGYTDAWFRLGNIIFDYKKDADSTVNCYLRVLRKFPDEENVFKNLNMVINSLEDNQHKIKLWEKILGVSPGRYEPNFYLANFYYNIDPYKSIEFAEKARKARPNDLPNLKVLANGYLNLREFDKALPIYDEYLRIDPNDMEMKKIRDNLYEYMKDPY